ncbi:hypothetical protein [Streptomyces sp. H27-H5]|uniref:hypothetical protein n=1 Tax=Streptomyces sp. H27-H5 TaxID=2996460 RepID=UPI002270F5AE|nr:hypothetical protein [Streptomyces sp. H27-H5]MCY0961338.1 hypothetical protein [Streptomyces sp. H27-H5]
MAAAVVGATALLGGGTTASAARAASGPAPSPAAAADIAPEEKSYLEGLKRIADPECDEAVTEAFERGQGAAVNEALKGWKTNGQAIPDGLPAKLRDFLETTRQLPAWADPKALPDGDHRGRHAPTLAAARQRAAAVDALHARVTPQSAKYVKATIEYFSSLAGPKRSPCLRRQHFCAT